MAAGFVLLTRRGAMRPCGDCFLVGLTVGCLKVSVSVLGDFALFVDEGELPREKSFLNREVPPTGDRMKLFAKAWKDDSTFGAGLWLYKFSNAFAI